MSEYEGQVWVLTYGWKKSNASGHRKELFSHDSAVKRHIDDVLAAQRTGEHEVRDFKVWSWDGKAWGEHELAPGWNGAEIGGARRTMRVRWAPDSVEAARARLVAYLGQGDVQECGCKDEP